MFSCIKKASTEKPFKAFMQIDIYYCDMLRFIYTLTERCFMLNLFKKKSEKIILGSFSPVANYTSEMYIKNGNIYYTLKNNEKNLCKDQRISVREAREIEERATFFNIYNLNTREGYDLEKLYSDFGAIKNEDGTYKLSKHKIDEYRDKINPENFEADSFIKNDKIRIHF